MPQYSLSEYTTRIAALIQDGQIEEAIAHARHILSHYPRYLPAYSMLAHACMEKGDLSRASHFFQSVLSANPQDADAWMNLAQLTDDLGEVEQAAWYMERAFELDPGNTSIREQLRELYSRRDGVERTRLKLTPTALALTQARSGSFRRASQKLQRLIEAAGDAPPLQVATMESALAVALASQEAETSRVDQVCASLLEKLPQCLQGNLVRARIYASAGRKEEGLPFLNAARRLDPEGEFAFRILGTQSPLLQASVEIPYLDFETSRLPLQQAVPASEDTSWLDEIGRETPRPVEEGDTEEALEPLAKESTSPALQDEPAIAGESIPATESGSPVPDWLREIQQQSTQGTDQAGDLDWLQETELTESVQPLLETTPLRPPEGKVPDWLEGLMPAEDEAEPQAPEPQSLEPPTPVSALPDWLLDLSQEVEGGEADQDLVETPDWLQQLEAEDAIPDAEPAVPTEPSLPGAETPESEATPSAAVLEAPGQPAADKAGDRERPAWLQELETDIEGQPAEAPSPQPPEQVERVEARPEEAASSAPDQVPQETYEWLSDLGLSDLVIEEEESPEPVAPAAEPALEPTPEAELPDWLQELRSQPETEQESEPEPPPQVPELEAPETLIETELGPEDTDLEGELPDWLQELEPALEPDTEAELIRDLAADEAPEWLSEPAEEAPTTVTVEEIPDWLSQLSDTEATAVEEPPLAEPEAEAEREPALAEPEPEPDAGREELEMAQEPELAMPVAEAEPIGIPPAPELDMEPIGAETPTATTPPTPPMQPEPLAPGDTPATLVQQFERLLEADTVSETLISELAQAVQAHPNDSALQRVLGDAYVRTNQLELALDSYRKALRKL
jgi:tetratricopeptide (TPR) repeat protein